MRPWVLGIGWFLGLAIAFSVGGCDQCEQFTQCTTRTGLRYSECAEDRFEFNDGTTLNDAGAAFEYCFCPFLDHPCEDGRTMTGCGGSGDPNLASFSDGEVLTFNEGYAACFGFDSCELVLGVCTQGRWIVACEGGGFFDTVYFASDGSSFDEQDAAQTYCTIPPA